MYSKFWKSYITERLHSWPVQDIISVLGQIIIFYNNICSSKSHCRILKCVVIFSLYILNITENVRIELSWKYWYSLELSSPWLLEYHQNFHKYYSKDDMENSIRLWDAINQREYLRWQNKILTKAKTQLFP